ncbi:MAG: hypothetical protein OEU97_05915 [Dehalococcoidia bacterium]|nr:hypothetical protein [Dehalococcoidia bacterium]MDH4367534.1 hypothetical protein [Dehalococcoidia bacterium]
MADFKRGIKAGAAAAGIYLITSVILAAIGQTFYFRTDFVSAAGLGFQLGFVDSFVLASSIWSYVFRGIVFGAIFAALYGFLPGATSVRKAVVLSVFLWIVGAVGAIYMTPGWPSGGTFTVAGLLPVSLSSIGLTLVSILSALAFGAVVGAIWNRLKGKEVMEVRNGAPALLVGLILGGLGWASETVGLSLSVVIGGIPISQILERAGPFWWPTTLYVSVVFLGLPGWVLAFLAWRRTRRGESAIKLGVPGGAVMALTGVMLLEGVLAIIGAVLSRRKATTELSIVENEQ